MVRLKNSVQLIDVLQPLDRLIVRVGVGNCFLGMGFRLGSAHGLDEVTVLLTIGEEGLLFDQR